MCKEIVYRIYDISKKCDTDKVAVMTNKLKFCGTLCDCEECIKHNEGILTLKDAKIWRIKDLCNCNEPECKCNEGNFCAVEWLNINAEKIVAFTLKKD